ncbi:hypothetical protein PKHYL_16700 [Psychrobacter sp. KH172YL61]|nr:hypothetical protein PKHYL_16700 [Psychrobacter sp. KH172YL61]
MITKTFLIKEQPVRILNAKKDWNIIKPRTKHVEEEYLGMYLKTLLNYVDRSSHLQAPHSNNARDIMLLFMFTGVRLNEAQPLKWSDVDLIAGRIVFKATKMVLIIICLLVISYKLCLKKDSD